MILHHMETLKKMVIILASGSPRRKDILQNIGLDVRIIPSLFEENLNPKSFSTPGEYVTATAQGKAEEVAKRLEGSDTKPDILIGADTCVCFNGEVYGKPKTKAEAFQVLSKFSNGHHEVITGVCIIVRQGQTCKQIKFNELTKVKFSQLSPELINAYIESGEPMDKAGGYGIQGLGGTLIQGITGDYYNVMGFPLHRFCEEISLVLTDKTLT